jgi:hypothetical protein
VTWTGTREGLGSRSSFAQYLGDRACSTINRAIERYRVENKKLFAMTFDELKALAAKRRPDTADRESAQLG